MKRKLFLNVLLFTLISFYSYAQTTFNYLPSTNTSLTTTAYGQIQSYLIPAGVTSVTITAAGATSDYNNNAAIVKAKYNVTPGKYLNILVGGKGSGASGGGGTFVTYESVNRAGSADFTTANNVGSLILAAGGAGSNSSAPTTLASNPSSLNANNGGGTYGGRAGGNGGFNSTDLPSSFPVAYGGYGGGGAYAYGGGGGGAGFGGAGGNASTTTYGGGGGFSGGTNFGGGTSWISNSALGTISGTQIDSILLTNIPGNGYVIIKPDLSANTSSVSPTCFGETNGSATITPTSGIAPYTYVWTSTVSGFVPPSTSSNSITNLSPGVYTCLVTDSTTPSPLSNTFTFNITQPVAFNAFVRADAPTCGSYNLIVEPIANILQDNDFIINSGFTLSGDASYISANGNVQLIPDATSKTGGMVIDLPATIPSDFVTKFRFKMLNKSGADGFSFNIGNDSFPGAAEDGSNQGLAIKFKNYNNDRVSASWNGTQIGGEIEMPLETGNWIDVVVKVINGKLSLYVDDRIVIDEITIAGYTINNAYKAIFKGRTGGSSNEVLIDDFSFANPTFEYSIDGTNYQTSNTFTNISLPSNNIVPIWLKQGACEAKVRDFTYPKNQIIDSYAFATTGCGPTVLNLTNAKLPIVYSNDFSTLNGYTLGKLAKKETNKILLNDDKKGTRGYMAINKTEGIDKDFGILFDHFALYKSGADGFSVSYGNPTPIYNNTVNYENGVTTGLAVSFKTYGDDTISIFYNGTQIGTPVNVNIETGVLTTYLIKVKNNQISVESGSGTVIIAPRNLPASYATDDFSDYKFIFAGRTGGEANKNEISNLKIANLDVVQYSINNTNNFADITPNAAGEANLPIVPADYTDGNLDVYLKFKNVTCPITNSPINVTARRNPINTITQNANVLTADEDRAGATYEWYICSTGTQTPLATTRSYTPSTTGGYLVKVKLDNCEQTSSCETVTILSTNDFDLNTKCVIYPNPSSALYNIDINENATIELFDIIGKKLITNKITIGKSQLDLSQYSNGVYLLKVTNEANQTKTVRFDKRVSFFISVY